MSNYFSRETNPQFVDEKDSLKSLILLEKDQNNPALVEKNRLAEELRIKNQTDERNQELINAGIEVKSKEDQAKSDMRNSRYAAKYQVSLEEEARNSLKALDKLKIEGTIDDTEKQYFDKMNLNTNETGEYVLDNYETFAFDNPEYVALYNEIVPQDSDRINPFWAPDPEVYQEFLDHDKFLRETYLSEQKDMSGLYNKLFKKDGSYTNEYEKLVNARDLSIKNIKAHDRIMNDEDDLNLNEVISEIKGDNLSSSLDAIEDLHKSKNMHNLVLDLQKTEYQARKSRRTPQFETKHSIGGGISMIEPQDRVDLEYAGKLDPRLFHTVSGIMDKGLVDRSWIEDYGIDKKQLEASMELLMNPNE